MADYLLGVDYGDKRVGLAITHRSVRLPKPFATLPNSETLLADLQKIIQDEQVGLVVVGLPRGMDGGYTEQTRKAEAFAESLRQAVNVPVELADETLTSVDAESYGASKQTVDAVAAAIILERYLTEQGGKHEAATL